MTEYGEQDDEQARKQEELDASIGTALRLLGLSAQGREFLRWVLDETGVFEQKYPADEKRNAWEAGRREFGLRILGYCARENLHVTLLTKEVIGDGK